MSDFKAFLASESEESDLEEDDAPQQLAFEVEMPPGIEDVEEPKRKRKTDADEEKIDPSKREKYKSLLNLIEGENEEEQQDMEVRSHAIHSFRAIPNAHSSPALCADHVCAWLK